MALSKRTLRSFTIALVAFICRGMGGRGGGGKREGRVTRKEVGITSAGNWSVPQKSEIGGIISGNSKLWVIMQIWSFSPRLSSLRGFAWEQTSVWSITVICSPRVRKVIPQMLLPSKTGTKHLDIKECIRNIYIAYTGMCISD